MTKTTMDLTELLQKHDQGDLLRSIAEAVLQLMMESDVHGLIGAVLFEQNDEWQTLSHYMMVEAFAQIDKEEIDPILSITTKAA